MAEHGIIMRPESIRAYQAGLKTQTRRVVRWPLKSRSDGSKQRLFGERDLPEINELLSEAQRHPLSRIVAPHGLVGDRLRFKETFRFTRCGTKSPPGVLRGRIEIEYRADGAKRWIPLSETTACRVRRIDESWTSSIFMPKWAARYHAPVTSLRIERLQDISEDDIAAEGCTEREGLWSLDWSRVGSASKWARTGIVTPEDIGLMSPRSAFAHAWDSINGKRAPWQSNPWVWVYGFPRYKGAA